MLVNRLVGRWTDVGSGVEETTFPLCYIFNKAKHAEHYSPLTTTFPFWVDQNSSFDFSHSCLGNINCNIGQMPSLYAKVPFFLQKCCGRRFACVEFFFLIFFKVTVTCFNALWRRVLTSKGKVSYGNNTKMCRTLQAKCIFSFPFWAKVFFTYSVSKNLLIEKRN